MPDSLQIGWIEPGSSPGLFPNAATALQDPNGLLAVGGDLSPERLMYAYRHGIFPWYNEGQPILWWSPDPRIVLFPAQFHISHSLRKRLRQGGFEASFDTAFSEVVAACAAPRRKQPEPGTWITPAMQTAYAELHHLGYAHSLEIRMHGKLAGGLYGVALGGVFFAESMFSRRTNASKIALACLAQQLQAWNFGLIDCQVYSDHLAGLGSIPIPRAEFLGLLDRHTRSPGQSRAWRFDVSLEF
ncbi:MAG: leucyl/phenylalanyl-tRNA--protein transferase [Gammaproteobacteria bacterium]